MEGQDKFYYRIRNEGIKWNHKRISRVYKLMGLNKRRRQKKRIPSRVKEPLLTPLRPNDTWSMDFMQDSLMNGRKFRALNIIDDFNRESLVIETYFSITASRVIQILEKLIHRQGKPQRIRVDNGPEFIALILEQWCTEKDIFLKCIEPGKPMQNGYIERFNRSYRQDVLDANWFSCLMDVRILSEEFRHDYNYNRPHESLGNISPMEYKQKHSYEVF